MKKAINKYERSINHQLVSEIESNKIEANENDIIFFRDDKKKRKKRKVYLVPLEFLKFRKDNGRIASDVLSYESNYGTLNEITDSGQSLLKGFLARKDPEKTRELKNSIAKSGQLENAVITCDGFLINGNRRKMVLESLLEDKPKSPHSGYLKVVILPDGRGEEPPPSEYDIEEIENRYQLQQMGKAEYYNFDRAISIRRKIEKGMSLDKILRDDPNYASLDSKNFKRELNQFKNQFLEPLKAIDRYLKFYERVGHYNTVSEGRNDSQGRWQAFLDYYNSVYKKLKIKTQLKKLKLSENDISKIEEVAFKIIRIRDFPGINRKLHQIMRDLLKLMIKEKSRKILYELIGKNKHMLDKSEIIDDFGKPISERTKDFIWINKFQDEIEALLRRAYLALERQTQKDAPIKLLLESLSKLNSENFEVFRIPKNKLLEFKDLIFKLKARIRQIETEIKNI